jgi:hypothetical protein
MIPRKTSVSQAQSSMFLPDYEMLLKASHDVRKLGFTWRTCTQGLKITGEVVATLPLK